MRHLHTTLHDKEDTQWDKLDDTCTIGVSSCLFSVKHLADKWSPSYCTAASTECDKFCKSQYVLL